ncbi:MFS transporter [Streptomyces cinnabarinus]|uniref:MFS transporter n=1 Tax=Streptomyces cinnabarinus TaxID=67287 RepID=A0ABY7K8K9_9ACTN|nr:MFS transporter [Streptomyces cinnabarinus]WAZ19632.1 MFS transporter [Streptomyces cinnabarinus]
MSIPSGLRRRAWSVDRRSVHRRLVVAVVVDTVGYGAFIPLTFLYLSTATDIPVAELGVIITVASLAGLPVPLFVGHVVDRLGARPVLIAQTVAAAAGYTLYFWVQSLWPLLLGIVVVTVADRTYWAAWPVFVSEQVADGDSLDRWYAIVNAAKSASLAAGSGIASVALAVGGDSGLQAMLALNVATSVTAGVLFVSLRTPPAPPVPKEAAPVGGWRALRSDRPYLTLTLGNTLLTYGWLISTLVLPVYLVRSVHLASWTAAFALMLKMSLTMLFQTTVAARLYHLRRTSTALAGTACFVVAVLLLACAAGPSSDVLAMTVVIAGVVFLALGEMLAAPATTSLAVAAAPEGSQGRYVSVFQLSWTLSSVSGPALVGYLLSTSLPVLWGAFIALMLAAALVFAALRTRFPAHVDTKTQPST